MRRIAVAFAAAAALLALPAAAGERKPEVRPVSPKVGGVKTSFTFTYDALGWDAMAAEYIRVNGPRGTRCHGMVISGSIGQEGYLGTRVVMGPRVKEGASGRTERFRPEDPESSRPLAQWCRGVYRGRIEWDDDGADEAETQVRFRFKVVG